MNASETIGWLAAALTLVTFSMHSMLALRIAAMLANICFITYGILSSLYPVIALHALLLPCNLIRLNQLRFREPPALVAAASSAKYVVACRPCERADKGLAERHSAGAAGRDWLLLSERGPDRLPWPVETEHFLPNSATRAHYGSWPRRPPVSDAARRRKAPHDAPL